MSKNNLINSAQQKVFEQSRLLDMLKYYEWLVQHGLSWDKIKGIRPLDNTPANWAKVPLEIRRQHTKKVQTVCGLVSRKEHFAKLIDYKLQDGTLIVLPWPPFDNNVIYNRRRT